MYTFSRVSWTSFPPFILPSFLMPTKFFLFISSRVESKGTMIICSSPSSSLSPCSSSRSDHIIILIARTRRRCRRRRRRSIPSSGHIHALEATSAAAVWWWWWTNPFLLLLFAPSATAAAARSHFFSFLCSKNVCLLSLLTLCVQQGALYSSLRGEISLSSWNDNFIRFFDRSATLLLCCSLLSFLEDGGQIEFSGILSSF